MTDPGREVPFVVNGETYTLYAGNRALRLTERETGLTIVGAMGRLSDVDLGVITSMLWALLQQKHPDVTMDDTDNLIDAAGYEAVVEAIKQSVNLAFPSVREADDPNPNGQQPGKRRAAGTGASSSPAPSPSD